MLRFKINPYPYGYILQLLSCFSQQAFLNILSFSKNNAKVQK